MRKHSQRWWIDVAMAYGLMLLLIALSSCNTHKISTTNIDKGSKIVIDNGHFTDSVFKNQEFWLRYDSIFKVMTFDITIYDTSVTDSLTNEHPVKAEIHGTTQTNSVHKEDYKSEETEEVIVQDTIHIEATDTFSYSQEIEKTVKVSKFASFNGFIFVMALLFAFVYLVKYTFKKVL